MTEPDNTIESTEKNNNQEAVIVHNEETQLQVANSVDMLPINEQLAFFTKIAEDSNTGVTSPAMALLLYNKAKELRIGWANAMSHMQVIKGKAGIDIHILKAIISRPGTGIRVELLEDYVPLYYYTDKTFSITWTTDTLPKNATVVPNFENVAGIELPVIIAPTPTGYDKSGNVTGVAIVPYDYRTTYRFTRKKKDIDGSFYTETVTSSFSWQQALTARLPFDKNGNLNPDSNWQKYPYLMIDHRAYTFGARKIASDLIMGCYELQELLDMEL